MAEPTEPKNNVIPHTGSRDMRDKRITGDKKTKEERQPVAATPREQIGRGTGEVKKPGSTSKYQFSEKVGGAFEKAGSMISGGSPLVSGGVQLAGKGVGAVADLDVIKEDTGEQATNKKIAVETVNVADETLDVAKKTLKHDEKVQKYAEEKVSKSTKEQTKETKRNKII